MTLVTDASVVVKWVLPEPGSEEAAALLVGGEELIAPELLLAEVANTLWLKVRRNEMLRRDALEAQRRIGEQVVRLFSWVPLLPRAFDLACRIDHPVSGFVYLALAEQHDAVVVTADRQLVDAAARSAAAERVRLLTA